MDQLDQRNQSLNCGEKAVLPERFLPGKIGVVTVLFGSEKVLPGFFDSIECQLYRNFEVFGFDNASQDRSVEMFRSMGDTYHVVANKENLGVAAANNQGIYAAIGAGCEYILLLNNDVEFGAELFGELVSGIQEHHADMAAPVMYYFDRPEIVWSAGGRFQPLLGYRCYHLGEEEKDEGQFSPAHYIEHAPTCCVLIHRSVFASVGVMDERYFVYHDDTDFMLRCKMAAKKLILLPDVRLWHKVSSLTGGSESDFSIRMGTRNRIFMTAKFLGRILASPYYAALSLVYISRRTLGKDSAAKYGLKKRSLREGFAMAKNLMPYRGL